MEQTLLRLSCHNVELWDSSKIPSKDPFNNILPQPLGQHINYLWYQIFEHDVWMLCQCLSAHLIDANKKAFHYILCRSPHWVSPPCIPPCGLINQIIAIFPLVRRFTGWLINIMNIISTMYIHCVFSGVDNWNTGCTRC